MKYLMLLIACAGALAVAAKPGPERFERYISEVFTQARNENARRENYVDALLTAGVGALREGRFEDFIFASRYHVSLFGKPITTCYGYFGQISCGHEK